VFGQIKQARGFRQFLLRGFENMRGEWAIVCQAETARFETDSLPGHRGFELANVIFEELR
jgi:hypothetical protein